MHITQPARAMLHVPHLICATVSAQYTESSGNAIVFSMYMSYLKKLNFSALGMGLTLFLNRQVTVLPRAEHYAIVWLYNMGKQGGCYMQVVERAQKEDLQQPQKYLVSFMRNNRGQVIIDRRFNTSQLVSLYLDRPVPEDVITWNPDNPNQLKMALPGL